MITVFIVVIVKVKLALIMLFVYTMGKFIRIQKVLILMRYMTDEQELTAENKTAMNTPHSEWHDVDKELPPLENEKYLGCKVSIKVLVSDGERINISRYDYEMDGWLVIDMGVTHWMYLPNLPKED